MTTTIPAPEATITEAPVSAPKKSKKVPAIIGAVLLGIAAIGGTAAIVHANAPITTHADTVGLESGEETFVLGVEDLAQEDLTVEDEANALMFGYGALVLIDMGMTEDEVVSSLVEEGAPQNEAQAVVDLAQENLTLDEG